MNLLRAQSDSGEAKTRALEEEKRLVDPNVKPQTTSCVVKDCNGKIIFLYLSEHPDPTDLMGERMIQDGLSVRDSYYSQFR